MFLFFIFALCLFPHFYDSAIVSQSSISNCEAGNDKEPSNKYGQSCEKKILVSMTLKGGQGETESLYANIDKVYQEGETEMSRLKKPFRIEVSKTDVIASYRVHYTGSANAKPNEVWFKKRGCRDDWYASSNSLPCGKQIGNDGEPIWDSQGFCCTCDSLNKRVNVRGNHTCFGGQLAKPHRWGSAHCMQHNELWYNVFSIDAPMMQYNITVKLLQFNGVIKDPKTQGIRANWTKVSSFNLNPTRILGRSDSGQVVAEIQGNLAGSQGPRDLSYKYLLTPSLANWKNETLPIQYTNGPSDWLLVDRHMVDLSGMECGKIGVSYSGFRRQQGRCNRQPHLCFTNQPLDLWEHDKALRDQQKQGRYVLSSIGRIDNSSRPNNDSFILKLHYEDLHNSFVTFRIEASNVMFVYNVGKARIINTYGTDFEALAGDGKIVVEIENTGDISGDFSISILNCGSGVHTVRAKTLSLNPGQSDEVEFTVQSYRTVGSQYVCEVHLYDSDYNLIQTATVDFKTNSTCFCFGSCGCTCESNGANGTVECPEPPPITIDRGSLSARIFLLILEAIGLHGIVGILGGTLIILGFIKLAFGNVLFCRKTKAQKFAEELKKQGVISGKGPMLVRCSGECQGARAAKDKFKRKLGRLKEMGKKPNRLDDWRNYSYSCTCQSDLADIKFVEVIKAIFFFYYCLILPCVWVGKKFVWGVLKDTEKQKEKAKNAVLKKAKKKGNVNKYQYDAIEEQSAQLKDQLLGDDVESNNGKDNETNNDRNTKAISNHKEAMKACKETENIERNSPENTSLFTNDVMTTKTSSIENKGKNKEKKKKNKKVKGIEQAQQNHLVQNSQNHGPQGHDGKKIKGNKHMNKEKQEKNTKDKKLKALDEMKRQAHIAENLKRKRKQDYRKKEEAKKVKNLLTNQPKHVGDKKSKGVRGDREKKRLKEPSDKHSDRGTRKEKRQRLSGKKGKRSKGKSSKGKSRLRGKAKNGGGRKGGSRKSGKTSHSQKDKKEESHPEDNHDEENHKDTHHEGSHHEDSQHEASHHEGSHHEDSEHSHHDDSHHEDGEHSHHDDSHHEDSEHSHHNDSDHEDSEHSHHDDSHHEDSEHDDSHHEDSEHDDSQSHEDSEHDDSHHEDSEHDNSQSHEDSEHDDSQSHEDSEHDDSHHEDSEHDNSQSHEDSEHHESHEDSEHDDSHHEDSEHDDSHSHEDSHESESDSEKSEESEESNSEEDNSEDSDEESHDDEESEESSDESESGEESSDESESDEESSDESESDEESSDESESDEESSDESESDEESSNDSEESDEEESEESNEDESEHSNSEESNDHDESDDHSESDDHDESDDHSDDEEESAESDESEDSVESAESEESEDSVESEESEESSDS